MKAIPTPRMPPANASPARSSMILFNCKTPGTAPQTRPLPPGHFAILDAWADMIRSGRAHAPKETALHEELIV